LIVDEKAVKLGDRESAVLARGDQLFVKWFADDGPEPIALKDGAIVLQEHTFTRK